VLTAVSAAFRELVRLLVLFGGWLTAVLLLLLAPIASAAMSAAEERSRLINMV